MEVDVTSHEGSGPLDDYAADLWVAPVVFVVVNLALTARAQHGRSRA